MGNSYIKFLDNFKTNAFVEGPSKFVDKQNIIANFGGRIHNISFNNDYTEFSSTRKYDSEIVNGKAIIIFYYSQYNMTRKTKRTGFKRYGVKRTRSTKKRKGGKKKNCTSKCKADFTKEIQTDNRFKALHKISSFFGAKKTLDKELNNVLDRKDIQNDKVFKNCVEECEQK